MREREREEGGDAGNEKRKGGKRNGEGGKKKTNEQKKKTTNLILLISLERDLRAAQTQRSRLSPLPAQIFRDHVEISEIAGDGIISVEIVTER